MVECTGLALVRQVHGRDVAWLRAIPDGLVRPQGLKFN